MPLADPSRDFLDPRSQPRLLAALDAEFERFWSMAAEPGEWTSPTACAGWETRDLAGHLLDAARSYLAGFEEHDGGPAVTLVPPGQAPAAYDLAARSFRSSDRDAVLDQLRGDTDRLLSRFASLAAEEWTGLLVTDRYTGALPASALAAGLLGGYAVHTWDLANGRRRSHPIDEEAADLLVPFVFALWAFTADTAHLDTEVELGVRVTGANPVEHRVLVAPSGLTTTEGAVDDCAAVLELDAGTLVLVAYQRVDAGTFRGDRTILDAFRTVLRPL